MPAPSDRASMDTPDDITEFEPDEMEVKRLLLEAILYTIYFF